MICCSVAETVTNPYTYPLLAKLGSKQIPINPHSLLRKMGLTVTNGVGRTAPFLTIWIVPPLRLTNRRLEPSGAQAIPVTCEPTVAKVVSWKLESNVVAAAINTPQPV